MYALALRDAGFQVIEAASAEEALDHLGRVRPVVIISDIALPGADGFELCQRIRRMEAHRATPIIGITAVTLIQAMIQARRAGFDEMLTKPCGSDELLEAVNRALMPPTDPFPKPKTIKAEDQRHTPSERAWCIRARRFGDSPPDGTGGPA